MVYGLRYLGPAIDNPGGGGGTSSGGDWGSLAVSLAQAGFQAYQGVRQAQIAKNLKPFDFMPAGLQENKALAQQQAFSRRAPGQAIGEENVRRNLATTLAAAKKMYGGDANKMAAMSGGANLHANDAIRQLAIQGNQFSESAYNKLAGANQAIAGQERQNYNDYWTTKAALKNASNSNLFNAVGNAGSAYLSHKGGAGYAGYGGYGRFNPYGNGSQYGQWMMNGPWNNQGQLAEPKVN